MEKKYVFDYAHFDSFREMDEMDRELVERARAACETAYAPYSNFRVGAAARLGSGRIVTGSNQESEVFPLGLCAERTLLFAHEASDPHDPVVTLAIASVPGVRECYPCGGCRQVLLDVERRQGSPIRIIMAGDCSASVVGSARDLLPFQFEL